MFERVLRVFERVLRDYRVFWESKKRLLEKSEKIPRISWFCAKYREILIIESFWEIIESFESFWEIVERILRNYREIISLYHIDSLKLWVSYLKLKI